MIHSVSLAEFDIAVGNTIAFTFPLERAEDLHAAAAQPAASRSGRANDTTDAATATTVTTSTADNATRGAHFAHLPGGIHDFCFPDGAHDSCSDEVCFAVKLVKPSLTPPLATNDGARGAGGFGSTTPPSSAGPHDDEATRPSTATVSVIPLYGFAIYHLQRDRGVDRGARQRAILVLTHVPMFATLLQLSHSVVLPFLQRVAYVTTPAASASHPSQATATPQSPQALSGVAATTVETPHLTSGELPLVGIETERATLRVFAQSLYEALDRAVSSPPTAPLRTPLWGCRVHESTIDLPHGALLPSAAAAENCSPRRTGGAEKRRGNSFLSTKWRRVTLALPLEKAAPHSIDQLTYGVPLHLVLLSFTSEQLAHVHWCVLLRRSVLFMAKSAARASQMVLSAAHMCRHLGVRSEAIAPYATIDLVDAALLNGSTEYPLALIGATNAYVLHRAIPGVAKCRALNATGRAPANGTRGGNADGNESPHEGEELEDEDDAEGDGGHGCTATHRRLRGTSLSGGRCVMDVPLGLPEPPKSHFAFWQSLCEYAAQPNAFDLFLRAKLCRYNDAIVTSFANNEDKNGSDVCSVLSSHVTVLSAPLQTGTVCTTPQFEESKDFVDIDCGKNSLAAPSVSEILVEAVDPELTHAMTEFEAALERARRAAETLSEWQATILRTLLKVATSAVTSDIIQDLLSASRIGHGAGGGSTRGGSDSGVFACSSALADALMQQATREQRKGSRRILDLRQRGFAAVDIVCGKASADQRRAKDNQRFCDTFDLPSLEGYNMQQQLLLATGSGQIELNVGSHDKPRDAKWGGSPKGPPRKQQNKGGGDPAEDGNDSPLQTAATPDRTALPPISAASPVRRRGVPSTSDGAVISGDFYLSSHFLCFRASTVVLRQAPISHVVIPLDFVTNAARRTTEASPFDVRLRIDLSLECDGDWLRVVHPGYRHPSMSRSRHADPNAAPATSGAEVPADFAFSASVTLHLAKCTEGFYELLVLLFQRQRTLIGAAREHARDCERESGPVASGIEPSAGSSPAMAAPVTPAAAATAVPAFRSIIPVVPPFGLVQSGAVVIDDTFELQRLYPIVGWSATLLPVDPPNWTDRSGSRPKPRDSVSLPHGYRCGTADWHVVPAVDGVDADEEGWIYATSFSSDSWSAQRRFAVVRKRMWMRVREAVGVAAANRDDDHGANQPRKEPANVSPTDEAGGSLSASITPALLDSFGSPFLGGVDPTSGGAVTNTSLDDQFIAALQPMVSLSAFETQGTIDDNDI